MAIFILRMQHVSQKWILKYWFWSIWGSVKSYLWWADDKLWRQVGPGISNNITKWACFQCTRLRSLYNCYRYLETTTTLNNNTTNYENNVITISNTLNTSLFFTDFCLSLTLLIIIINNLTTLSNKCKSGEIFSDQWGARPTWCHEYLTSF